MKAEIKTVTPDMARKFLSKNSSNRPVRTSKVKFYSQMMKEGKWNLTGQGITIATNGQLLDGQHRLLALIDADISIDMLVVTDAVITPTYDCGISRNAVDQLRIVDGNVSDIFHTNYGIACIKLFNLLLTKGTINIGTKIPAMNIYEIRNLIARFMESSKTYLAKCYTLRKEAVGILGMSKIVIPVTLYSIHLISSKFTLSELSHFTNVFYSGISTSERDAVIVKARNRIVAFCAKHPSQSSSNEYIFKVLQSAVYAYCTNQSNFSVTKENVYNFTKLQEYQSY